MHLLQMYQGCLLYTSEPWLDHGDISTVNGRRTQILKACLEKGKEKQGIFRLTVPTGGGKTISSLAFALQHAAEHHLDRIIYVIPYTSIIEQNAQVFKDILGENNVLEDHCNVVSVSYTHLLALNYGLSVEAIHKIV